MKLIDAKHPPLLDKEPADSLIELGTVSVETRGEFTGIAIEGAGLPFRWD